MPEKTSKLPSRGAGKARRSVKSELPNSSPSASFTHPRMMGAAPVRAPKRVCGTPKSNVQSTAGSKWCSPHISV